MSRTTTLEQPLPSAAASHIQSLAHAYVALFKPRVSAMSLITAATGLYLGRLRSGINPFEFQAAWTIFGIAVVTCGSSVLNQVIERRSDARMARTRARPMATGRISLTHGLILGFAFIFFGSLFLAVQSNLLTGTLTLFTAITYVAIYTPMKRITSINTFIGAFPGALPPLIGWTAARGLIEWPAVALFAIIFVWQFPHFMAVGWMLRNDYRDGGIIIAATKDPISCAARYTVWQALFFAILMIPVSFLPTLLGITGKSYIVIATVLSLIYLWYTIRFAGILREPSSPGTYIQARNLLKVSVIYLPLLLGAMVLNAQGRFRF